jgi:tRNA threonylcarbamoyladenosine biosynthesis protein TsaB
MGTALEPILLLIETSGRLGQVALARGASIVAQRQLDEARRHARDLAPTVGDLLAQQGLKPRDLGGVFVSHGPGSYTGLRVGIMSAKALAYATGCRLLAVDTLPAIARQAPAHVQRLAVLSDAQQGKVYVQEFARSENGDLLPVTPLAIHVLSTWLDHWNDAGWLTGPGLRTMKERRSTTRILEEDTWDPRVESLLAIGFHRWQAGERDDVWSLEPLYLRPSAAEEKWDAKT